MFPRANHPAPQSAGPRGQRWLKTTGYPVPECLCRIRCAYPVGGRDRSFPGELGGKESLGCGQGCLRPGPWQYAQSVPRLRHEMEWFLRTTPGGDLKYHFRLVVMLPGTRILERHDSGGCDEGGITISRRPNKRPSREKAPGPSNASAAAITITPKATILASCRPAEGSGNHERAIPRKDRSTKSPAIGVRNPAARAAPLTTKTKPSNHFPAAALDGPER